MSQRKRPSSPTGHPSSSSPSTSKAPAVGTSQPSRLANANGGAEDGMGEFEDAWEDEYEEEDIIEGDEDEGDEDDDGDGDVRMGNKESGLEDRVDGLELVEDDEDEPERSPSPEAYLPSSGPLPANHQLEPDLSTYHLLHTSQLTWPALSFDVLRDPFGQERRSYPAEMCVVAGTQAEQTNPGRNDTMDEVVVMRWEGLSKVRKGDADLSDEEDEEDEEEDVEADATLTHRSIPHVGSVNRIRAQPLTYPLSNPPPSPPAPYHVATFSETGKVHIYDVAPHLNSLLNPAAATENLSKTPTFTINSHGRAEGFALAWGPPMGSSSSSRLLSGDVHSKIFMTTLTPSGITPNTTPFTSHTSSVEDLQWSPSEPTVFASCSADRSLRIWDVRVKNRKSVITVDPAHDSDVNVLSWNAAAASSFLIVTGGDEGGIKVWDLRGFRNSNSGSPTPVASFSWHTAPITSIEWHPTEDSSFAASGADDQITLWDLSVELDEEERATGPARSKGNRDILKNVPAQLLFVHQGQRDIKELHWHPQIPGTVVSTALDGFNVFKTISI